MNESPKWTISFPTSSDYEEGNTSIEEFNIPRDVSDEDGDEISFSLTGIDASALSFGGSVKVQANASGAVITGIITGDGSGLTGLPSGSEFNFGSTGITTTKNLGINTTTVDNYETVGAANSFRGIYIGDGSLIFNARLDNPNGYYIGTGRNALNAGPITLGSTMTLDGAWVIV